MKTLPPLLIVADRGQLRAYAVTASMRGPVPTLLKAVQFSDGNARTSDVVSDSAGAFPAGNAPHATGAAERMTLTAELEMRAFRDAAECTTELLRLLQPESWGFAAPSEINGAILDGLDPALKSRLTLNVQRDLTNVPRYDLLEHFVRVQEQGLAAKPTA